MFTVPLQKDEETNYSSRESDESKERDSPGASEGDTITKTFHVQLEPYMYLTKKISKSNHNAGPYYYSKSNQYLDETSKNNQGHVLRSSSIETNNDPDIGKFTHFSELKAIPRSEENLKKYNNVQTKYFQLDEENEDQPNKLNNLYSSGLNANDIRIENGRSVINSLKEYLNKPTLPVNEMPEKYRLLSQSKKYGSVKKIKSVLPFQNENDLQTDIYFPTGSHASFRNKQQQFANELPKNTKAYSNYNKPVHVELMKETNKFNNIYPDVLNVNDDDVENSNVVINSLKENFNKPVLVANKTPYKNGLPNKLKRYGSVKKNKPVFPNKNAFNLQSDLNFPKEAYTSFENKLQLNELPKNTKTFNDYNNDVYDYNNGALNKDLQKINNLNNLYSDELNVNDKEVENSNIVINSLKEGLNKPILLENEAPKKYGAPDTINNYGTVKRTKLGFPNENAFNLQSNLYFPKDPYNSFENEYRLFELPKNTKTDIDYNNVIHSDLSKESQEINKRNNVYPDEFNVNNKVEKGNFAIHSLKKYLNKPAVLVNKEGYSKYRQPGRVKQANTVFPNKNAFNVLSSKYLLKDTYPSFESRQPFTNKLTKNINFYNDYNNAVHDVLNKERNDINKLKRVYHDELNVNDKEVENGKITTMKKYPNAPVLQVNEEPDNYRQPEKLNNVGSVKYIGNAFPNANDYDVQQDMHFPKETSAESVKQEQLANELPKNANFFNEYYEAKQGDLKNHEESSQQENKQSNNFKLENFISKYFQPENFESKYYKSENGTLPVEVLDSLKSNGALKKIDINVKITAYFEPQASDQGQLNLVPGDSK